GGRGAPRILSRRRPRRAGTLPVRSVRAACVGSPRSDRGPPPSGRAGRGSELPSPRATALQRACVRAGSDPARLRSRPLRRRSSPRWRARAQPYEPADRPAPHGRARPRRAGRKAAAARARAQARGGASRGRQKPKSCLRFGARFGAGRAGFAGGLALGVAVDEDGSAVSLLAAALVGVSVSAFGSGGVSTGAALVVARA